MLWCNFNRLCKLTDEYYEERDQASRNHCFVTPVLLFYFIASESVEKREIRKETGHIWLAVEASWCLPLRSVKIVERRHWWFMGDWHQCFLFTFDRFRVLYPEWGYFYYKSCIVADNQIFVPSRAVENSVLVCSPDTPLFCTLIKWWRKCRLKFGTMQRLVAWIRMPEYGSYRGILYSFFSAVPVRQWCISKAHFVCIFRFWKKKVMMIALIIITIIFFIIIIIVIKLIAFIIISIIIITIIMIMIS